MYLKYESVPYEALSSVIKKTTACNKAVFFLTKFFPLFRVNYHKNYLMEVRRKIVCGYYNMTNR